ncbi:MAG: hypothetical protein QW567_00580 [Candidatus Hadarchaeales archaeon]
MERVSRIIKTIERAISIPPRDFRELSRRWKLLEPSVERVLNALKDHPSVREKLRRVLTELDGSHARLLEMMSRADSRNGLRMDWERFAEKHASEMKDWLLGLREVLQSNSEIVELGLLKQELEESTSLDVHRLFGEMRKHGLVTERTWLQVRETFSRPDWRPSPEVLEELRKIAGIFLEILRLGEGDGNES